MTTKNTVTEAFEFTGGFHPYFLIRERDDVVVKGLANVPYVYAEDMTNHVQVGDLAMTTSTDHVFSLPEAPKHEFAILDPGLKRALAMASTGHASAIVWNPGPGDILPDFQPDDWRKFVCVEPVTSWPKALQSLKPGETHELACAIQSTADGLPEEA